MAKVIDVGSSYNFGSGSETLAPACLPGREIDGGRSKSHDAMPITFDAPAIGD
jgi:hypothetical protein